ncbi:hypothetical protein [Microbacterium sp. MPKO10]|uniref:hypothetical protein n=1 Tax=Microbacterium sp. MPKO10 TaxID=2989818 RepID=UPI00223598AD|nr:hypothetical protein [Microbacterium sp. MPKO10]MCW4457124.1 hypothetical protein [Microbacterium sp. MPKO10]
MMLLFKDHSGIETVLNIMLIRFGIIAAIVVVVVIVLFAIALWLRRHGALGKATRHAAPLARKAAVARARTTRGRSDLMSSGLSLLATTLERSAESRDSESLDGETHDSETRNSHRDGDSA